MLLSLLRLVAVPADLPEPTHSPEEVRDAADEILSRPEYAQADDDPSWLQERLDDFAEWFGDIVDNLFGAATIGGALPNFVGYIILGLLVAGIVALIVWAVRRSGSLRAPGRGAKKKDSIFVDVEEYRTVREWLSEAEEHERAGRWRQGILCRYRALVTDLVERDVLSDVVGKTAGEYVQDMVAAAPPGDVAPTFATATDLFEAVWYGGADAGPAERDRFAVLAQRVLDGLSEPSALRRSGGPVAATSASASGGER